MHTCCWCSQIAEWRISTVDPASETGYSKRNACTAHYTRWVSCSGGDRQWTSRLALQPTVVLLESVDLDLLRVVGDRLTEDLGNGIDRLDCLDHPADASGLRLMLEEPELRVLCGGILTPMARESVVPREVSIACHASLAEIRQARCLLVVLVVDPFEMIRPPRSTETEDPLQHRLAHRYRQEFVEAQLRLEALRDRCGIRDHLTVDAGLLFDPKMVTPRATYEGLLARIERVAFG